MSAAALRTQARVVHALLLREIVTRYGRHNIGFMWLFVEPMLFTLGIAALWSASRAAAWSSLPVLPFALSGYGAVLLWRNTANRCAHAIEPNKSLLFHRNVRIVDLYLARALLEVAGVSMAMMVLAGAFILGGWMAPPADLPLLLAAWLLLAGFACGLGFCVGALCERSHVVERLWHAATYLLFPLSGAVFMVDWLPPAAREAALWLPMVQATEMLRAGTFGERIVTHFDAAYLLAADLALLALGGALVRGLTPWVEGA